MKSVFSALAMVILFSLSTLPAGALNAPIEAPAAQTIPVDRFGEVSPGIYRGARPDLTGMMALAKLGVRTIVNLDNDEEAVEAEATWARNLGLTMISKPLSGFWTPDHETVDEILHLVSDQSLHPVFIHCQHGQDRTGLIVGLYRVEHERWPAKEAYSEMLSRGFHRILIFLDRYFRVRVGL